MIRPVIHDSKAPGDLPFSSGEYLSAENETKITQSRLRVHCDLPLAVVILGIGSHIDEESCAKSSRKIWAFIFVEMSQFSLRRRLFRLRRVDRVFHRQVGILRCTLVFLCCRASRIRALRR